MIKATGYTVTIGFVTEEAAREEAARIVKERGYIVRIIKAEEI